MDALAKLFAITEKLQNLPDGEEKTKLLNEAKELIAPAKEEVEISERLLQIETEHELGLHSED
jgi:hypothetical protein